MQTSIVAAGNIVRKLLILESEHGPLSGYEPAVTKIVEYLDSVSLTRLLFDIPQAPLNSL